MIAWIAPALMSLAVAALIALAVLRARGNASTAQDASQDLEIYRKQLDEVDRDRAKGIIPEDEAERLRTEIARRLIAASLAHVSGPGYPPRSRALTQMIDHLREGQPMTLGGCIAQVAKGTIRITREPAAVAGPTPPGQTWDTRWQITGPFPDTAQIAATTADGLKACPDWRDTGFARTSLIAAPAVWVEDRLISAPLAGYANGFHTKLLRSRKDLDAALRAGAARESHAPFIPWACKEPQ